MKGARAHYKASAVHLAHAVGRATLGPAAAAVGSIVSLANVPKSVINGHMNTAGDQLADGLLGKHVTGAAVAVNGVAWEGYRTAHHFCKGTGNAIGAVKDAMAMKRNKKIETADMRTVRRQHNAERAASVQQRTENSIGKANRASSGWAKSLLSPKILGKTFAAVPKHKTTLGAL